MAATFIGGEPVLTGATFMTAVAAPASGKQRQILSVIAYNRDTVEHTFEHRKLGGTNTIDYEKVTIPAGLSRPLVGGVATPACVVLDAVGETYEVRDDATATTTEPALDTGTFEVP